MGSDLDWRSIGGVTTSGMRAHLSYVRGGAVPEVFIHCAANVGGREGIDGRKLWQAEDFELDRCAIEWAIENKVKRFIYFSSSAVYPTAMQRAYKGLNLIEGARDLSVDLQGQPDQIYGLSKLVGEHLVHSVHGETQFTIFRPFSGYGPGQDLCYPMPAIIARAQNHYNGEAFEVWGPKGSSRDWIHIDDICHAVRRSLELPHQETPFTVNLCTGRGVSFEYLAQLACVIAGKGKPQVYGMLNKPTGVMYRVGDPSLLNRTLMKDHVMTTLEEGVYDLIHNQKESAT